MAAVSQLTEAVFRSRYEDQVLAGAAAATKAMKDNTAAFVENDQQVTRNTKNA